ncbi:MAG: adenylate kinase [Dehalococcoidales bacterium]|nr:adenylate kinase [Dehalococcoidales bacterium]
MMYVVFLGAPGAGKGTQAAVVAEKIKLEHVASGDLFRQALEKGTELGKQVKSYMEKGMLVPDEITIRMVLDKISKMDSQTGIILDGFPRTLKQAEELDKALAGQSRGIDKAVYIKVGEKELLKRLSGRWICRNCQAPYHIIDSPPKVKGKCDACGGELYQRADDTLETARKRLEVYFTQTAPLIDYYQKTGKLLEINGEGKIDEISRRIVTALKAGRS